MMMLPKPLVPAEVDLRDFPYMPLDVVRLRDSGLSARSTGEEFRCAVLLWCASWHQIPAASLADDDVILASLAGFGRSIKEWQKYKKGSLHGWIKCADGRLYHPVVAEKANEAWKTKLEQRWRTECARIRKANERFKRNDPTPSFEEWLSNRAGSGQLVTCDMPTLSHVTDDDVTCDMPTLSHENPCETASKRREGKGYNNSSQEGNSHGLIVPLSRAGGRP